MKGDWIMTGFEMKQFEPTLLAVPWNDLAADIHQTAVDHGWWEYPRSMKGMLALVHSELSEALEEYRDDMPMLWFQCIATEEGEAFVCNGDHSPCKQGFITEGKPGPCIYRGHKPEGIAVELADAAIRILDLFGQYKVNVEKMLTSAMHMPYILMLPEKTDDTPDVINYLHDTVSEASHVLSVYGPNYFIPGLFPRLALTLVAVFKWLTDNGVDAEQTIRLKHEYNKTRPYRHGGKTC